MPTDPKILQQINFITATYVKHMQNPKAWPIALPKIQQEKINFVIARMQDIYSNKYLQQQYIEYLIKYLSLGKSNTKIDLQTVKIPLGLDNKIEITQQVYEKFRRSFDSKHQYQESEIPVYLKIFYNKYRIEALSPKISKEWHEKIFNATSKPHSELLQYSWLLKDSCTEKDWQQIYEIILNKENLQEYVFNPDNKLEIQKIVQEKLAEMEKIKLVSIQIESFMEQVPEKRQYTN